MENSNLIVTPYYRNGNGKDIIVHTCFQGSDGLFQFGNQRLSEEEIDKLIALIVSHRWILIMYPE